MSGLSTTGSTVITGSTQLPHAMNLWRHALHWLGGMGIIVLAVAILPLLGVGGMQMYRAEAPGPVKDAKLTPRITQTAKALWIVYAGMTAACFFALWAAGMPAFDALCHAFSVMSLGGFSTHDASVGCFDSPADRVGADRVHADRRRELRHALHRPAAARRCCPTGAIPRRAGCSRGSASSVVALTADRATTPACIRTSSRRCATWLQP